MCSTPKTRNRVGRNIFETHCIGSRYDPETRKSKPFNEVINGNVTSIERAVSILKKRFDKGTQFIVEELHHSSIYVSAPLDKFMEIADQRTVKEID